MDAVPAVPGAWGGYQPLWSQRDAGFAAAGSRPTLEVLRRVLSPRRAVFRCGCGGWQRPNGVRGKRRRAGSPAMDVRPSAA